MRIQSRHAVASPSHARFDLLNVLIPNNNDVYESARYTSPLHTEAPPNDRATALEVHPVIAGNLRAGRWRETTLHSAPQVTQAIACTNQRILLMHANSVTVHRLPRNGFWRPQPALGTALTLTIPSLTQWAVLPEREALLAYHWDAPSGGPGLTLFDLKSGDTLAKIPMTAPLYHMTVSNDELCAAIVTTHGVAFVGMPNLTLVGSIRTPQPPRKVAFSHGLGRVLVHYETAMWAIDTATAKPLWGLVWPHPGVPDVSVCGAGQWIVMRWADGKTWLYSAAGDPVASWEDSGRPYFFPSRDGTCAILAGPGRGLAGIEVRELGSGRSLNARPLPPDLDGARFAASPDGRWLAESRRDGTLIMRDFLRINPTQAQAQL